MSKLHKTNENMCSFKRIRKKLSCFRNSSIVFAYEFEKSNATILLVFDTISGCDEDQTSTGQAST